MAITKYQRPINANANQNSQKQVGGTYGERRQLSHNHMSAEPTVQRAKDFFGTKQMTERAVETFASNTKFIDRQVSPQQIEKALENGLKKKPVITDQTFLNFLNKVIAGPAENKPPQPSKLPIKK